MAVLQGVLRKCCKTMLLPQQAVRVIARTTLLLPFAVLLCAWGIGPPGDFLAEEHGVKRGVDLLREMLGPKARIFSVEVLHNRISVLAQDPLNNRRIEAWRLEKRSYRGIINWESVVGPEAARPTLINPDLEANLFDLAEVNIEAADQLKKAAIARADLDDPARASEIVIRRRIFIIPPASGAVEWNVHVASEWEDAEIYANADGTIRAADLVHTHKAQRFDLFKRPDLAPEAAKAFRSQFGTGNVLLRVRIDKKGISFATNLRDERGSGIRMVGKDFATFARYSWSPYNLCGGCVEQAAGNTTYIGDMAPNPGAPFGIDDADWTIAPRLIASAKEQLGMPEGEVTEIELSKPVDAISGAKLSWKVEVKDKNRETGSIRADLSGSVQQVVLPESRATPLDWLSPDAIMAALSRTAKEYGPHGKLTSIEFGDTRMTFVCQDPQHPGELVEMELTSKGFSNSIARPFPVQGKPFTITDLQVLTAPKISAWKAQTLALIKQPDWTVTNISIERSNWSRKGAITIEMRAFHPRTHNWGRVVYELDGAVVDLAKG
jgi:hypothetical protein